jgi:hypothetical protein
MSEKPNDILAQENYSAGYNEKIEELKNNKEFVELDKLHYYVFHNDSGKKLIEEYKNRFLIPGFTNPNVSHCDKAALYFEGFKEAFRLILNSVKAHEQRIEAENKKNPKS